MQTSETHSDAGEEVESPSAAMLRALADGIPQLAWIADGSGSIHWYNKRWYEYTGTTLEEMRGWGWRAVHHPDHVDRVVERIARAFATGEPWEDTFPLRAKDGTWRWFLSRAQPVKDADGRPVSWFGTNTDVTEQRRAEDRAQADAERVRLALAAGAIVGTWFWDLRTDRFTIDEQFARAFGIDPERLLDGLGLQEVITTVHPEDKPGLEAAIAQAIARGGPYAHQYRVRRADGRYYWIEANGRVDHAPDGTPISFPGVLVDVEERRATAEALRTTLRRLNAVLDNTEMAVFLMDERQYCVYANAAAERLTGYALAEMEGRPLHDVVHHRRPDGSHYPIEECPIDRAFPARAQIQGEETFVARDGSFYPVAFTASPVLDDDGRPIGTVLEARDITEEKARDAALRESEARLRSMLNALPQMVWTTGPDGMVDFYNDRWYEFTGVPHGSTDGDGWVGVFHPEDQGRATKRWWHSHATGEPYEIEYRMRHNDGVYRWTLGRALPIRDGTGAIVRWIGTCTDIEDLKRTSDELRRASALLRLIGDSTPDLIYAKDRESRILYANAAVQRAVGRPLEEIVGRNDLEYASDPSQAQVNIANDRRVFETGQTIDVDETFTSPDGETRHYRSVKAPLRNEEGRIVGIVGVTSDVTKRREAEERERLLAREVDHRAKNMLAVVQSIVRLTRVEDPAAFKKAVNGRIQSLARAHDLLVAAKWEGVDLADLVVQEFAAFADRHAARFEGPPLRLAPLAAQSVGLVLHEMATNAAKYGALSKPEGRLDVSWSLAKDEEGRALLRLVWEESGGPPAVRPSKPGFGTTLIRNAVERQLGGELRSDWRETGLACEIRVPADQLVPTGTRPGDRGAARRAPDEATSVERLQGKRVLVVEDEVLIGMQIEEMLAEVGCAILGPASSLTEALRLLGETRPDAALLDVNLGRGEYSYSLADILAASNVPFAFCTGYTGASEMPAHLSGSVVMSKPIRNSELTSTLALLVSASEARTPRAEPETHRTSRNAFLSQPRSARSSDL